MNSVLCSEVMELLAVEDADPPNLLGAGATGALGAGSMVRTAEPSNPYRLVWIES